MLPLHELDALGSASVRVWQLVLPESAILFQVLLSRALEYTRAPLHDVVA